MTFPTGFIWGAATAAHQVEGGNVYNDSWAMEHAPGSHFVESSGDAVDHYHRFREDIAIVADLGLNAYRFSLEWSRIEPERGEFSRAALGHYRRMLEACCEHGLLPIVTFHHFTSPRWITADGGWENDRTADAFAGFCERVMEDLGELVPYACTINEPNIGPLLHELLRLPNARNAESWAAAAAQAGATPDKFVPLLNAESKRGCEVVRRAHRLAVDAIKGIRADCQVGVTLALHEWLAEPGGEETLRELRATVEDVYLEGIEGDFVGVQTYTHVRVGSDGALPPRADDEVTQMHYPFAPEAVGGAIRYAAETAGLPVLVTENGIATDDDTRRIEFVERAVREVEACLDDGLDVRGYTHWSLFDNFEWTLGYRPTFGLVAVDRATQERTIKPSARRLGEIARANRL